MEEHLVKRKSPEQPAETRMERLRYRVEEARSFNLLSDTFMSVALRDQAAAQEVIRIFTGIPDLKIVSLSTQVRLPRMVSHDAILDVVMPKGSGTMGQCWIPPVWKRGPAMRNCLKCM